MIHRPARLAAFAIATLLPVMPALAADAVEGTEPPVIAAPVDEPVPGTAGYVAARIGAAFESETEFNVLGTSVDTSFGTGLDGSLAVGVQLFTTTPLSLRAEAELGTLILEVDSHDVAGVGSFSGGAASGDATAVYGLANAYLDYDLGVITPYFGAGIGVGTVDYSNFGTTPTGTVLNDNGTGLAWQVGAGVGYKVSDSWSVDIGYRYLDVGADGVTAVDGTKSDAPTGNHQVRVGVRRSF